MLCFIEMAARRSPDLAGQATCAGPSPANYSKEPLKPLRNLISHFNFLYSIGSAALV